MELLFVDILRLTVRSLWLWMRTHRYSVFDFDEVCTHLNFKFNDVGRMLQWGRGNSKLDMIDVPKDSNTGVRG